ncbi:MAG TPA: hypothetical protein V6D14_16045 [Coleofasciculaceae cyanobacterium]
MMNHLLRSHCLSPRKVPMTLNSIRLDYVPVAPVLGAALAQVLVQQRQASVSAKQQSANCRLGILIKTDE